MRLQTKHGSFSAVQHFEKKDLIHVRAQDKDDLERLCWAYEIYPEIENTPGSHYPFRMNFDRHVWSTILAKEALSIDYSSFKDVYETRKNRPMKKKLDVETRRFMGLDENGSNDSRYYEYDEPITRVKIRLLHASQGEAPLCANFYNGEERIKHIWVKGNAVSLTLTTYDKEEGWGCCADPRMIATYILAAWLGFMFGEFSDLEALGAGLSQALSPVFTKAEALEWLEKNRFCGPNSLKREAMSHDKMTRIKDYFEVEDCFPGWSIYAVDREMYFVPPCVQELYNKYIGAWREKVKNSKDESFFV